MKALSITEPYATLIRNGIKKIETRSWKTNYRGELLIHASSTRIPKKYKENHELMKLVNPGDLHFGQIVAKCKLVDCVKMTPEFIDEIAASNTNEYISGFYEPGRYAWILEDVIPVNTGKIKGSLGLWNYNGNEIEEGKNMAVTRTWKVYGFDGHRQRQSFGESVKWDWSNKADGVRIFEADNFDKTGTHDYSLIRITRNTYKECEDELWGQISDGYFENSRTGDVIEVFA